ncbi:MAG: magnesium transporter [Candidatus Geothermarchaeales archaeon]
MARVERGLGRLVKEILFGEIFSLTGSLFAGLGLAYMLNELESLPGFLVLVPAFMEMRGNISGASSARITTDLYLGTIPARFKLSDGLKTEILTSFLLTMILSAVIGVFSHYFNLFFGFSSAGLLKLAALSFTAGLLSSLFMIFVASFSTIMFFRRGLDPNNVMGPFTGMFGDVVSILSLFLAAQILLRVMG